MHNALVGRLLLFPLGIVSRLAMPLCRAARRRRRSLVYKFHASNTDAHFSAGIILTGAARTGIIGRIAFSLIRRLILAALPPAVVDGALRDRAMMFTRERRCQPILLA